MLIDAMTRTPQEYGFNRKFDGLPGRIDEAADGSVIYLEIAVNVGGGTLSHIRRITKADTVSTIEHAVGAWDNRATLSYVPD